MASTPARSAVFRACLLSTALGLLAVGCSGGAQDDAQSGATQGALARNKNNGDWCVPLRGQCKFGLHCSWGFICVPDSDATTGTCLYGLDDYGNLVLNQNLGAKNMSLALDQCLDVSQQWKDGEAIDATYHYICSTDGFIDVPPPTEGSGADPCLTHQSMSLGVGEDTSSSSFCESMDEVPIPLGGCLQLPDGSIQQCVPPFWFFSSPYLTPIADPSRCNGIQ